MTPKDQAPPGAEPAQNSVPFSVFLASGATTFLLLWSLYEGGSASARANYEAALWDAPCRYEELRREDLQALSRAPMPIARSIALIAATQKEAAPSSELKPPVAGWVRAAVFDERARQARAWATRAPTGEGAP